MGLERSEDWPEFFTNDDPIELDNPGEFVGEGDPEHTRSKFFKTSLGAVKSVTLVKLPIYKRDGQPQRTIRLDVITDDSDYVNGGSIGTLTVDGLKFSPNPLSHCGADGCEFSELTDVEKARILQELGGIAEI